MTALSVAAGSSLAGPSVPVPGVFSVSLVAAESCIMACTMAVVTFLACCRAVASRVFVSTFHVLGFVCSDSAPMY